ncbi:unnamed protein product [Pleuronectes platessa]|uniref:Uncharacterized protein n=1 Tax=Pleuronectes platessa TaxID=8262 RepID=A0A9N7UHP5_PLEPL|nr:unnamed protein product [Pleuronectes platessa]
MKLSSFLRSKLTRGTPRHAKIVGSGFYLPKFNRKKKLASPPTSGSKLRPSHDSMQQSLNRSLREAERQCRDSSGTFRRLSLVIILRLSGSMTASVTNESVVRHHLLNAPLRRANTAG